MRGCSVPPRIVMQSSPRLHANVIYTAYLGTIAVTARRMFEVVHEVPGRLRLRSHRLQRNPALAAAVVARLQASPGVLAAQASERTGSLLIHHDAAPGRAEMLCTQLAATPAQPPAPASVLDKAMDRLAAALLERLAEQLVGAVAAALI